MLPKLTLALGGASSGKSQWAEGLIVAAGCPRLYVATAQAFDSEMLAKIADHRAARGPDWPTIEAPLDLAPTLREADAGTAVLLDCVTMWLSNNMLAAHDLPSEIDALLAALTACAAPIVVVSNEVGLSGVPENALARQFQRAQGQLNQRLAQEAELVVQVIAGLPLVLKGSLPGTLT